VAAISGPEPRYVAPQALQTFVSHRDGPDVRRAANEQGQTAELWGDDFIGTMG
jgi:hypothetical protein